MKTLAPILAALALSAVASVADAQLPVAEKRPQLLDGHNIIVILADDMAIDTLLSYAADPGFPVGAPTPIPTPGIDALLQRGIRFTNAWTNPVCSPTRAAIQTGNYGFRTGIGHVIEKGGISLPSSYVTLPALLTEHGADTVYRTAAFGKWHLHGSNNCDPIARGYDLFVGSRTQVPLPYCFWERVVCDPTGQLCPSPTCPMSDVYMPEDVMQSAIDWITGQPAHGAYFCYLAPQTPYELYHTPPAALFPGCQAPGTCASCGDDKRACFDAALCAFDSKISELLAAIPGWPSNTTIFFVGDNGTPAGASAFPAGRQKGTLYEGGIHVPFIVAGKAVAPDARSTTCDALVQTTDLYRTIARLAGANVPAGNGIDSVDLRPLFNSLPCTEVRSTLYTEIFTPPGYTPAQDRAAVRDTTYKLIYDCLVDRPVALYDLSTDPHEGTNLIVEGMPPMVGTPAGDAYCSLLGEINSLKGCGTPCQ